MKKLSRVEMKNVIGGKLAPGGGGQGGAACTSDSDCTTGIDINCNGTIIHSGAGKCYAGTGGGLTCHYSVAC